MGIFPTTVGIRPRLACELRTGSAAAARAEDAAGLIAGSGVAEFSATALRPGLTAGNLVDAAAVSAAIKRAMEQAGASSAGKDITLIVPDLAVRVILLDFETLPGKAVEALPVVRFRLKKLVPFDAEQAAVSYQVMASEKGDTRVLAVAIPLEVLAEYEAAVRGAGFEPGAVLPSTLAALAGAQDAESSVLAVNASASAVTTAIVQAGVLRLHRPVELHGYGEEQPSEAEMHATAREIAQAVSVAAAYFEDNLGFVPETVLSAGPTGAEALGLMLEGSGLRVREMVGAEALAAGAASSTVKRGLLAGVRGALRS